MTDEKPRVENLELHADIEAARRELAEALDALDSTTRAALQPANLVRHNAGKLAAGAGAVGFMAVGGPNRLRRALGRVVRGGRPEAMKSLLPQEIERAVADLGDDAPVVKARLERAFAEYLDKRHVPEPSPGRSLWRLFDAVSIPVGQRITKGLVDRLLNPSRAADVDRERSSDRDGTRPAD